MNRYTIHIDPVYNHRRYSIEINDHKVKKTILLDNTYYSRSTAFTHALKYINSIGARCQMGGYRSSKPLPSVSKAECVGSIPTAPANSKEL